MGVVSTAHQISHKTMDSCGSQDLHLDQLGWLESDHTVLRSTLYIYYTGYNVYIYIYRYPIIMEYILYTVLHIVYIYIYNYTYTLYVYLQWFDTYTYIYIYTHVSTLSSRIYSVAGITAMENCPLIVR